MTCDTRTAGAHEYARGVSEPRNETPRNETEPRKVKPVDPPMVPFVVGGMIVWAVIGLALLPFRATLEANGRGEWLWVCLAGVLVAIPGLGLMIIHDRNRKRRRAAAANEGLADPD